MADAAPEVDVPPPAPIADLPSGDPIPSSTPPSKPPKRQPLPLGALLAALPSNLDSFLVRLEKCLSTPSGIDTVMLFLCYASKLSGSVLSSLSQSALRRSAREWIALVAALPRGTTVVFSSPAAAAAAGGGKTALPTSAALALLLSKRLTSLSSLLSEARMIMRLWSLLGMYFWARRLLRHTFSSSTTPTNTTTTTDKPPIPTPSKLATLLEYLRLALCITFQSLENGAYLSSRGIMSWTPAEQGRAFKWSARFWAAYVGIEIGRLAAERFGPSSGAGAFKAKTKQEKSEWTKKTVRQLAWAPLTLHWGSDKGLVSDTTVGVLACIPGVIQMRDLWASTA
ncbi:hypothetical protein F5144DRAFT_529953 [Chaetomium tenue]|uniref:Uncharacterized protein n=1 Tax=Chaetomium tenue TaxID=1854479 RepID=A0ACB7PH72_9PEZI|nr:hypothetical protein F5144DRAFT_529953 [Chaetomium globosum]